MIRMTGAVAALAVLLCTGCASVTEGTTHALRIDTVNDNGDAVTDADCTLSNDKANMLVKSGTTVQVRRSSADLEVVCRKDGLPDASGRLVSRANAGMAGNIILGGAIGAAIDHSSGAAYTYPHWVRLVFGQFGVFDRNREREGVALSASMPLVAGTGAAATLAPLTPQANAGGSGPGSAAPAPAAVRTPLPNSGAIAKGESFDYVVTDRTTGLSHRVVLRAERVENGQVWFNNGTRIETTGGDLVSANGAVAGEMDLVTPPGGWMPGGRVPSGSWKIRHVAKMDSPKIAYDLDAYIEGEQKVRVGNTDIRTLRIALRGWAERQGTYPVRARYEGTAWLSPELHRLVRFEAQARTSNSVGILAFTIDESTELVRIGEN